MFTILHTMFVLQVYSGQCVLKDNCRNENVTDFNDLEKIPSWVSVKGDCFVPYVEQCRLERLCAWTCV